MSIILIAIIISHIILSTVGTMQLSKSIILTLKQKRINIFLLWIIPFLWFLIIRTIHRPNPGSADILKKNDISSNNFYDLGP
jgi:hypothetical protein